MKKGLVFLCLGMALAGCSGNVLVTGVASTEDPITGADVSLVSPKGRVLANYLEETQQGGTFVVSVPPRLLRDGYRIVVSGGVFASTGAPSPHVLSAFVPPVEDGRPGFVHVGFLSTLTDALLERRPGMTPEEAENAVGAYLGLPETLDLHRDGFFNDDFFDHDVFAEAVGENGLNAFVDGLLDELEADPGTTRTFLGTPADETPEKGLAGTFLNGLVEGAGQEVGSRAAGWAMDQIFGKADTPSAPTDPVVLAALQENAQQLKAIADALEVFQSRTSAMLLQILTTAERTQYLTLVAPLGSEIALLETLQDQLWLLCEHVHDNDPDYAQLATDLNASLNSIQIKTILKHMQDVLGGTASTPGAIDTWGFLQARYATRAQNHNALFGQFQYYANMQITALNLLLERTHKDAAKSLGDIYVADYLRGMEVQADAFLARVEGMMALMQNYGELPAYMSYVREWNAYNGDVLLKSPTRESAVLAQADAIALEVQNTSGALVIRLARGMYADKPHTPSWLATVPVTIQNVNTGAEYVPDKVYRRRINQPDIVSSGQTTHAWQLGLWDVNRYVFTTLPQGAYAVKNINIAYPCPDPTFRKAGNELFHPVYLNTQTPMVPGEFHNLLVTAYANPMAPV
ncbi:MAG: hypothetical protein GXY15_00180 [Candidatus Hydrogenedentes bacterium]|nr:hypothetical protein [Candidatus Hydrogenedentota bacterium]